MLFVLLDDGQSGVATKGDAGEVQKNRVYYLHRSYRRGGCRVIRGKRESRERTVQNRALTGVSRKDKADMVKSLGPASVNNCDELRALRVVSMDTE